MIRIYGNGLTKEEIALYLKSLDKAIDTLETSCKCQSTPCHLCKGRRICRELHQMEGYIEFIEKKIPLNKTHYQNTY